jgi:uncharacterized protein (DUF433 family)
MDQSLANRITSDPAILGGKPIIRGMRIRVSDILGYLAGGETRASLLEEFEELEDEDISAALAFAAEVLRGERSPKIAAE